MPTYLFRCKECNKEWRVQQPMNLQGGHVDNCPKCGKKCENLSLIHI